MVICLVVVNMVNVQRAPQCALVFAALPATIAVSLANLSLKLLCEFVSVLGVKRIGKAARLGRAPHGAKLPLVHVRIYGGRKSNKRLTALPAGELSLGCGLCGTKALHGAVLGTIAKQLAWFHSELFAAARANGVLLPDTPGVITSTRAKNMSLALSVVRSAVNNFSALLTRFVPRTLHTGPGAVLAATAEYSVGRFKKLFATLFTDALDRSSRTCPHTGARAEASFGGWCGGESFATLLADKKHKPLPSEVARLDWWGARHGKSSLSAGHDSALALPDYTLS